LAALVGGQDAGGQGGGVGCAVDLAALLHPEYPRGDVRPPASERRVDQDPGWF